MSQTHQNPIATFYNYGFADAQTRKRKRPVTQNYKLAYVSGWFDSKLNRPNRFTK